MRLLHSVRTAIEKQDIHRRKSGTEGKEIASLIKMIGLEHLL